jgi:hypothetical protein
LAEESGEVNSVPHFTEFDQFLPAFGEKRAESRRVSSSEVMKRRGDLNEAVQKGSFVALRFEPDGFPGLMGFKEFFRVEETNAVSKSVSHESKSSPPKNTALVVKPIPHGENLTRLESLGDGRAGFEEQNGCPMNGDPFKEQRFDTD